MRSTRPLLADKRAFYSLPSVSASYDALRFGDPSGARVNQRELAIAGRLLSGVPRHAPLLDLACGTGRLTRYLESRGYQRVVAVDYSWPMLQALRRALAGKHPWPASGDPGSLGSARGPSSPGGGGRADWRPVLVQGDAFALPFAAGTFAGAAALRFAFHWADLAPLLAEMRRVVAPGAPLVLETCAWTPRAFLAVGSRRWGGRVFAHPPATVRGLAARLGLAIEAELRCFAGTPYLYRRLPLPAALALEALERAIPAAWLSRVYWRFRTPA